MSMFGDLGNIFHSIGHFFTNGSTDNYQPNNVNGIVHPPSSAPAAAPPVNNKNAPAQNTHTPPTQTQQTQLPQGPAISLFQGYNPNDLSKVQQQPNNPNLPFNQHVAQVNADHGAPANMGDRIINTVADSAARAAIGLPQGAAQLWDLVTPGKGENRVTKTFDAPAKAVDADQQQNGIQGRVGSDIYHGLQVAENLAPGAVGAVAKGADLVKAAPNIIKSVPDLVKSAPDIVKAVPTQALAKARQVGDAAVNIGQKVDNLMKMPEEIDTGLTSANPDRFAEPTGRLEKPSQPDSHTEPSAPVSPEPTSNPATSAVSPTPVLQEPPVESPAQLVESQSIPSSETPITNNNVAQMPNNSKTAPNAPNIRAQAQKDLDVISPSVDKDINDTVPKGSASEVGDAKVHEVLSNQDLTDAANRYVQSMSDKELLHTAQDGMTVNNAGDIAKAYATVKRLGQMAKDGDKAAQEAIPKILDAVEAHVSAAGRSMNFTGAMLDSLPKEAQENYIVKSINRIRSTNGLDPLDSQVEIDARADIQKYLTQIESKKDAITKAQGELERYRDGTAPDVNPAQLARQIEDDTREVSKLNYQVGRSSVKWGAVKGNWGKTAGRVARGLMLTKATGRASDIVTTAISEGDMLAQKGVSSLLGKAYNKITGKRGGVIDTLPSPKAVAEGTFGKGFRDLKTNYNNAIHGSGTAPDLYSAIHGGVRSGKANELTPFAGVKAGRVIQQTGHAMAETATNLTEGLGTAHIQQRAAQAAKQAGLEGDEASRFVKSYTADPPAAVKAEANKLVEEANNMNDNPLARMMHDIASSATLKDVGKKLDSTHGGKAAEFVGETLQNIVAPFTHWMATAAWNGATERNSVANLIKAGTQLSVKDGHVSIKDPQKFVDQLGGLVVHTGEAIGAGYMAAKTGILTDHNAEGYNDSGLYLHLGGHYIPIGDLGFVAPGVVMGWATHKAFTEPGHGSVIGKISNTVSTILSTTLKSDLNNSIIGGSNEVITQLQDWLQNKNGIQGGDVVSTAAADALGNYIPGAFGDVNTAINSMNLGNLDPTREAALTKVTKGELGKTTSTGKPSSATDIPHTDLNKLINRVPFLSQQLPRNPGVAANDLGSSVARGDNASKTQAEENSVIDQLPAKQQNAVRNTLRKTDGAAQYAAQKSADAMPAGSPAKVQATDAANKLAYTNSQSNPLDTAVKNARQADQVARFKSDGQGMQTIGDKTYANVNGKVQTFATPHDAQRAIELQEFKDSGKDSGVLNGVVYQKASNGKISHMEQKDYDYKTAAEAAKSAKESGDLNGTLSAQNALLGNIQWQLNHATLTDQNRSQLIDKAASTQSDFNKYQLWDSFTKPTDAPSYEPKFTGGSTKSSSYIKEIKAAGAKYNVDINALLSVAAQEGLGGGVGDNGTSFGPFQLHEGGALPQGKDQAWAESPAGIDYAVKTIASVAKGKVGPDAINAIVHEFEKSADPNTEAANALAVYEGGTANLKTTSGTGSTVDSSGSGSSSSGDGNTISGLPALARESFIENGLTAKPVKLNLPHVPLTQPDTLIKAHKITVSSRRA